MSKYIILSQLEITNSFFEFYFCPPLGALCTELTAMWCIYYAIRFFKNTDKRQFKCKKTPLKYSLQWNCEISFCLSTSLKKCKKKVFYFSCLGSGASTSIFWYVQ